MKVKTIGDLESLLENFLAWDSLQLKGISADESQALAYLVGGDSYRPVKVSFHRRADGRKLRADASIDYWNPSEVNLQIQYEPRTAHDDDLFEPFGPRSPDQTVVPTGYPGRKAAQPVRPHQRLSQEHLRAVLRQLRDLESNPKFPFVALKLFRDKTLPRSGARWAQDLQYNRQLLDALIECEAIVTERVPNPHVPGHPTTTIRSNREHPLFDGIGATGPAMASRRRVQISGAPLSQTILEGRR